MSSNRNLGDANIKKVIPIPSTGHFFKAWLEVIKPLHHLTDREMDLLAEFLKRRHQLQRTILDKDMIDSVLMTNKSKKAIRESCNISDVYGVHFGRPLSDGTYSDSRVLSIAEILKLIGTEDDFLEPLIAKGSSEEDFDGLTFENNMLIGPDEKFVREVLGEHVCPKFFLNLMTTLPLPAPANDNESQTEEKTDAEPEK